MCEDIYTGSGCHEMRKEMIRIYRGGISEIISFAGSLNGKDLTLMNAQFPPVTICHPLWTLGHLSVSAQSIGGEIGIQGWLDPSWEDLFGQMSDPSSDASRYPDRTTLVDALKESINRVCSGVESLTDDELQGPIPDERFRVSLPTCAHALGSILIDHVAEHRRMLLLWRYFVLQK